MGITFTQERGLPMSSRKQYSVIRNPLFTDRMVEKVDGFGLGTSLEIARALALYIKILGNDGMLNCVSMSYIDFYDGKRFYAKFNKWFDKMFEYFERNNFTDKEIRNVLKRSARQSFAIPTRVNDMKKLHHLIMFESSEWLMKRRRLDARKGILDKFKLGIKKYLHLTYELGYNEPSLCALTLAKTHKIDKYIMSGDFPLILLPFLPEIEESIQLNYEKYEMKDAWNMLKDRYFNQKDKYMNLAIEIKSVFAKNIGNFSNYFDKMYSDTYYKLMLLRKR